MHLDADDAVALACLPSAALAVEGEPARPIALHARFRELGERLADMGEQASVGRGIRSRRASDGALIDVDYLVEMLDAIHALVRTGTFAAVIQLLRERAINRIEHERRF